MMVFGNKCRCSCEEIAFKLDVVSQSVKNRNNIYDERIKYTQEKLVELLLAAGILVESEKKKENAIYYEGKRYVVKKVK